MPSVHWPRGAKPLPIEPLRPAIERLHSLALRYPGVVELLEPLEQEETAGQDAEGAAEPSAPLDPLDPQGFLAPVLAGIADEFGGVQVAGERAGLMIVPADRTDLGPYTVIADSASCTPLHEGEDVAVVLALDETGAAGAVYGIGEDLALTLAATSLQEYLERYTDALERAIAAHSEDPDAAPDADAVAEAMEEGFFAPLLGAADDLGPAVALTAPGAGAPAGAVAEADLRGVAVGTRVETMDAELPPGSDPLALEVRWREAGLVVDILAPAPASAV